MTGDGSDPTLTPEQNVRRAVAFLVDHLEDWRYDELVALSHLHPERAGVKVADEDERSGLCAVLWHGQVIGMLRIRGAELGPPPDLFGAPAATFTIGSEPVPGLRRPDDLP